VKGGLQKQAVRNKSPSLTRQNTQYFKHRRKSATRPGLDHRTIDCSIRSAHFIARGNYKTCGWNCEGRTTKSSGPGQIPLPYKTKHPIFQTQKKNLRPDMVLITEVYIAAYGMRIYSLGQLKKNYGWNCEGRTTKPSCPGQIPLPYTTKHPIFHTQKKICDPTWSWSQKDKVQITISPLHSGGEMTKTDAGNGDSRQCSRSYVTTNSINFILTMLQNQPFRGIQRCKRVVPRHLIGEATIHKKRPNHFEPNPGIAPSPCTSDRPIHPRHEKESATRHGLDHRRFIL